MFGTVPLTSVACLNVPCIRDTWIFSPLRSSLEMERKVAAYEGELVS